MGTVTRKALHLCSCQALFATTGRPGPEWQATPLPQRLFINDSVFAKVYSKDRVRIEQTIAAGIEAIFILLGQSDLAKRQDPISLGDVGILPE